jgi:hypothetical protein
MAKRTGDLWVIEFDSPDSSQCFTNAYHSKAEAVDIAIGWIKDSAQRELDQFEWKSGEEAPEMLKEILQQIDQNQYDEAIYGWLEYQSEYDPEETIAIGPSGQVSERASDYQYHSPGGSKRNPTKRTKRCDIHEELSECQADPDSCGWAGCDVHSGDACGTPARHYDDTKSFMCDEGRKQFLETYHWDDEVGAWVDKDGNQG